MQHPIAARDALNNQATSSYRADGLIASATDPRTTTTFTYDANGLPISSKTGLHAPVNTVYDALGRMLSLTDQAGTVTSFTYDALGQLTSQTDRNGDTATVSYTPTSKLDIISYPARAATAGHPAVPGFSVDFTTPTKTVCYRQTPPSQLTSATTTKGKPKPLLVPAPIPITSSTAPIVSPVTTPPAKAPATNTTAWATALAPQGRA